VEGPIDLTSDDGRERLVQLFRYAQVGRCVNSVTHDLNNLLGAILAYSELVGMDLDPQSEAGHMVSEIAGAVRKSSDLVNNLTTLAREEQAQSTRVAPRQLIEQTLDLRRYDIRAAHIVLETHIEEDLPTIPVDQAKLGAILIHLLSNAIEQLGGRKKALIRVSAINCEGGVEIRLWDSGGGVLESTRDRIFDLFFTTKAAPHLGLGLPLARRVAEYHEGSLVYSDDQGFVLTLPAENALQLD
jgi:signal transduction histidine kinase